MELPVNPPIAPMLAKAVGEIPDGPYSFEPKWDGFRAVVFRDGDEVEIGSRNERPMTRYFPELVAAIQAELPPRCVVDGEIVIPDGEHGGWTSRRCCSGSIRRPIPGQPAGGADARATSSPSTCSPLGTRT